MRIPRLALVPALLLALTRPAFSDEAVTVAVAYFDNTAAAPELEVLRKGIADMLITDLAQVEGLRLVEREKLEALLKEIRLGKGPFVDPKTAQKMGKGLGASLLISGSFLSLSPSLRVDARVISVETGEVMATASAQGAGSEFFKVQSELALKLVESLGAKVSVLGKARILKPRTRSLEALTAYSRGLDAEDHGDTKGAQQAFTRALAVDPEFARAQERLAALEKRVAELEKRTTELETSGGYILKPQTPADWFANAQHASQKGDGARVLESFLGGWKASHGTGARLPLVLFMRTLAMFAAGTAANDAQAREVLDALGRSARDASLAPELRALYALLAGGDESQRILESLAARDGFAAWCLGIARDAATRPETPPVAGTGKGPAQGTAQRQLMSSIMLPVLPSLEMCGASKYAVAACIVPRSFNSPAEAVLAWIDLTRRHGAAMRAFAEGRGGASFDDAGLALLRRYLLPSMDLLDRAAAIAAEHPLLPLAAGAPPDAASARAFTDRLLKVAAARPETASEHGESRPTSLFTQLAPCLGKGGPGWARVRELEGLSEAEFSDEVEHPVLWTPRRTCETVDAALRGEVARRFVDSKGWKGLGEEGPRAEGLAWLTLDVLVMVEASHLLLHRAPVARPPSVTCSAMMSELAEVAAARVGSPALDRIARWSDQHESYCGLFPGRETADALHDCKQGHTEPCLALTRALAKAMQPLRDGPAPLPRGFWAESQRALAARCQADRPFCTELGEIYLAEARGNDARDPRRTAGSQVLDGACKAGSLEACVVLANFIVEGSRLQASEPAAVEVLRTGLSAARRECDQGKPCLAQLDAGKRCASGDLDQCELLVWMLAVTADDRGERAAEVRRGASRMRRDLEQWCEKHKEPAACELARDPVVPVNVTVGHHGTLAIKVADTIEGQLVAPVIKLCRQGVARACALQSDFEGVRAARFSTRAADPDAEARARAAGKQLYDRALAGFEKACRDGGSRECPRWLRLEQGCVGGDLQSCELLFDEMGRDYSFRRVTSSCRGEIRRCHSDSNLERVHEESQQLWRSLKERCEERHRRSPDAAKKCELSKQMTTAALPHIPEAARPIADRLCAVLAAHCVGPKARGCQASSARECCQP